MEKQIRYLYDQYVSHAEELTMEDIINSVRLWVWEDLTPLGKKIHRLVAGYIFIKSTLLPKRELLKEDLGF